MLGETGILDPESRTNGFVNPRFQEACLTLALAVEHGIGLPEGFDLATVEMAAIRSMEQWFRMLERNGAVRCTPEGLFDAQATAYGLFAASRTMTILGDRAPSTVRSFAQKVMKRSARFLSHTNVPEGLETRPLRAAALQAAADWLGDARIAQASANVRRDGLKKIRDAFQSPDPNSRDFGSLSLAMAYLTLSVKNPAEAEIELWKRISIYGMRSTTPGGIPGGGAETSIACMPLSTGFVLAAQYSPEAASLAKLIENGWKTGLFGALLDPDVPWLTPMGYLLLLDRANRPEPRKLSRLASYKVEESIDDVGGGRITLDDWTVRLARGGTIGWLHHNPTNSARLFGSPSGLALREGPWLIEGNRVRQPSLAGKYTVNGTNPFSIDGSLYSLPIPGTERSPRRIGHPDWQDREAQVGTRLAPPWHQGNARSFGAVPYHREITIKDGALTIETQIAGRIMHRIPMIWAGDLFGELQIDKHKVTLGVSIFERRVREIVFTGGVWPSWILRFDRPVDIMYEPIHVSVTSSPMRFLSAASGALDILAQDRLHMAWRIA